MRRLTMLRERERGSVALIVAILFGTGVLLGCAALAIDVGSISAERRQLQNSSDAVALAAAMDCVRDATCPTKDDPDLVGLANDNAEDDATRIARAVDDTPPICGKGPGLPDCLPVSGKLGDCVDPASGTMPGKYVRVYTQTEATDGSTILPYFFGQAVVGDGSTGTTQQTCSTVGWGPIGSMTATLPVTFSSCEWWRATGGDPLNPDSGTYPPNPPYPPYPVGFERTIYLQDKSPTPDPGCESFNGHDIPGGFGWLDDGDSDCQAQVTTAGWAHVNTGNMVPGSCSTLLNSLVSSGKPVLYVPVYDCMRPTDPGVQPDPSWTGDYCKQGNGSNAYYHIAGFAQFYLTGWYLSGGSKASPVTGVKPCSGGSRCLSGFFLKGLVPQAEISTDPTTPSFGLDAIQMVG
jgi:hypothetical protein